MKLTYTLRGGAPNTLHNVAGCGMAKDWPDRLYIRMGDGIEMLLPLAGLERYRVEEEQEGNDGKAQ